MTNRTESTESPGAEQERIDKLIESVVPVFARHLTAGFYSSPWLCKSCKESFTTDGDFVMIEWHKPHCSFRHLAEAALASLPKQETRREVCHIEEASLKRLIEEGLPCYTFLGKGVSGDVTATLEWEPEASE